MLKSDVTFKPTGKSSSSAQSASKQLPKLEEFLSRRDYAGATTLLEFKRNASKTSNENLDMWIGYCAFHAGGYILIFGSKFSGLISTWHIFLKIFYE